MRKVSPKRIAEMKARRRKFEEERRAEFILDKPSEMKPLRTINKFRETFDRSIVFVVMALCSVGLIAIALFIGKYSYEKGREMIMKDIQVSCAVNKTDAYDYMGFEKNLELNQKVLDEIQKILSRENEITIIGK